MPETFNQLPSLQELEELRIRWIAEAIGSGLIDRSRQVIQYYGIPIEIKYRTGNFRKLELDNYIFQFYEWGDLYSPSLGRALTKSALLVADINGAEYTRISFHEPYQGPEIDHFVVLHSIGKNNPCHWHETIDRLHQQMTQEKISQHHDDDLILRKNLANRLHLQIEEGETTNE